jgi:hypothetical protein
MEHEIRTCRVCLCDDDHPCVTPAGPCFWFSRDLDICSACAEATAAHQVKHWWPTATTIRATCACGWSLDVPDLGVGRQHLDDALYMHLRNVMQAGNLNPKLGEHDRFADLDPRPGRPLSDAEFADYALSCIMEDEAA